MTELLIDSGQWFRTYQYQSAMAIVATLLVIFGNDINLIVKRAVAKQHLLVRCLVFILVCAFGYGLLTIWLTGLLAQQLAKIPSLYILPSIIGVFVLLALYAQKQKHI